jgi:putative ABC transport system permease protein
MAEVEGLMRIRHRLRPGEPNSSRWRRPRSRSTFWTRISQVMLVALPGLVGISLVVGAVVIMNIMLVSVTERTSEIGLRKSLGARRGDILQFLIEAGTLSGVGGLIGIGLGWGSRRARLRHLADPAQVAPWSIGLALAWASAWARIGGLPATARRAGPHRRAAGRVGRDDEPVLRRAKA